ncbi:PREDICTED: uncharacterized protein LOC109584754 [Amphimedon queenslandica]|uniref:Uncharacterized protein n=1 Tax=Amphimedon queenslandica TaxID=400682 RepID=A0A1X7VTL0_AMPQE|nr:PREDICTED: uncharacterized protein LOC109584754 [Amphimedon queenslandica]|eukprot:XP_019856152.1 PREDICTED: uncharacterized protein LOC109584754 [Amphimedon queenslandica]
MNVYTRTGAAKVSDVRQVLSSQFGISGSELKRLSTRHHSEGHFRISGPHEILHKVLKLEDKCPKGWRLEKDSTLEDSYQCVQVDITYSDGTEKALTEFMKQFQQENKLSFNYAITLHKVDECKFFGYNPNTSLMPMLKVNISGDKTGYAQNCDQFRLVLLPFFSDCWILWTDSNGTFAFQGTGNH